MTSTEMLMLCEALSNKNIKLSRVQINYIINSMVESLGLKLFWCSALSNAFAVQNSISVTGQHF
jgi:hypothetical protein